MYFTEEMIPLSLFSEIVPAQERQALARRLLDLKPDQAVITHVIVPDNVSQNTTLADLAGVRWRLLVYYEHSTDWWPNFWLTMYTWSQSQAYQSSLANILAFNVVNNQAGSWGCDAPLNLPKGPLLATKWGKNGDFEGGFRGWDSKSPLLRSKRSTFWGSHTSPPQKKINPGYRPVNDSAEHGVKLSSDFLAAAHFEKHY